VDNESNFVFDFVPANLTGVKETTMSAIRVFGQDKSIQILKSSYGSVQIYDLTGSLIKQLSTEGDVCISLPAGLYVVKVKTADTVFADKILVK